MTQGRNQLRALERIVSEMRGGARGPDTYNTGSLGGGEPPQNVRRGRQDMNQVFRTNPAMHPAEQEQQPAWQPASPDRQGAREAHRQGPGPPQQPDFAPVNVGKMPGAPEVHFLFCGGTKAFHIDSKGTEGI